MPLRIGFDLDGVFADMEGELARQAEVLFGNQSPVTSPQPAVSVGSSSRQSTVSGREGLAVSPTETGSHESNDRVEVGSRKSSNPTNRLRQGPGGQEAGSHADDVEEPPLTNLRMTPRQQYQLWNHVEAIENFWETLQEIEPGTVARLAALAADRRWEIIFLTRRPAGAGATSQVQSQRWLEAKGFALPSVFVVQGSRGRIASALALDLVVDDTIENCLDVVVDSKARALLVWRDERSKPPAAAKRLGIRIVNSVGDCLELLSQIPAATDRKPGVVDRMKRLLGSSSRRSQVR